MQEHKQHKSPLVQTGKRPEGETFQIDPVDDILLELTAMTLPELPMVDVRLMPEYVRLITERVFGPCAIANCSCEPCMHGDCGECWVEQTRGMLGDDDSRTRDLIQNYRKRRGGW